MRDLTRPREVLFWVVDFGYSDKLGRVVDYINSAYGFGSKI